MNSENESPEDRLFLESSHRDSRRLAIVEDNGVSAWLYLTESGTRRPAADAWVYNRIAAPPTKEIASYRGGPPPAAIGYASDSALCASPHLHEWSFIWSDNGDCVALTKDGDPVAFIVSAPKASYSRELIKDGPWGRRWSDSEFARVFGDR